MLVHIFIFYLRTAFPSLVTSEAFLGAHSPGKVSLSPFPPNRIDHVAALFCYILSPFPVYWEALDAESRAYFLLYHPWAR